MAEQALTGFSHHVGDKPIVLIADDSRVVRVSLKNVLKDHCQIIEAENGQEAWEILCNTPTIALVFSDLSMPKLDGRSLLSKIRNSDSPQIATVPFIVVTGNEESPDIHQELTLLGADEVINKPFDPSNIRNFLTTYGNRKQDTKQEETDNSLQPGYEPQSDFLDGVVDREDFMASASRELAFAIRNKNELSIALVKIDQINEITMHYSEPAIEHILLSLVEIITQHIHPDDTLAYFGNGLFAILRPASNAIGTRYLGRRILEDLSSKQFYLGESEQIVSASIGISAPNIKPGTRLIELLSLAEDRLKAAIENGGNKVIDKGGESLAQVNLVGDTSELSSTAHSQYASTQSPSELQHPAAEQVDGIRAKYGSDLDEDDDESSELIEHKQTIERLTNENRQLINEIAHWKKQSAQTESLRRQLFEVESQQQQLQVKFSALQNENTYLDQQTESLTRENNNLLQRIDGEESENRNLLQRTETVANENRKLLEQAETVARENKELLQRIQVLELDNQTLTEGQRTNTDNETQLFIEEENRRLENQLTALTSRAEKAEADNLKSSQLVNSLNENIKLLHMQLDQLQQQLSEEKQKNQRAETSNKVSVDRDSNTVDNISQLQSHSDMISDLNSSDMLLKPMPDATPGSAKNETPSVHLFPEQDQAPSKQQVINKPSIPPFRVEPEPLLFKNGFYLSSFTIASIIFTIMLIIGGIYLRSVLNTPASVEVTVDQATEMMQSGKGQAPSQTMTDGSNPAATTHQPAQLSTTAKKSTTIDKVDNKLTSDQRRLQKEQTLRRMAEKEFNLKAQ